MLVGLGSDIIDIGRVEKTIKKFGTRFIRRIFTNEEIKRSENQKNRIASYAKRFAAKEACSKALGTGFSKGVFWKDIKIVNSSFGEPLLRLQGGAAKRLKEILPKGSKSIIKLSLSDDQSTAYAVVIISSHANIRTDNVQN